MRPHLLRVSTEQHSPFSIRHNVLPYFRGVWHYHAELELHYVIKGEGIRLIGDKISNFSAGELVLLGSQTPHCWRCGEEYFAPGSQLNVEVIVLQFLPECLGNYLLSLPEAYLLPRLFEKAKSGLVFSGITRIKVAALMQQLLKATGLDRLILMVSILKELAEASEGNVVAISRVGSCALNDMDASRFNNICNYTLTHFRRDISLEEIAAVGNLSVTSFCRYFKMMTNQKYSNFLTQLRISYACKLLINDKISTDVVCSESGFYNVSNFYRHFKKFTDLTPQAYKNKYKQSRLPGFDGLPAMTNKLSAAMDHFKKPMA